MLFAAFEGWSDVIANVQRLGYVIDTVRLTVLRKCLRAVWSVAAVRSRRRRLEAKALSRMHYARQRKALEAWRGTVAEEGAVKRALPRATGNGGRGPLLRLGRGPGSVALLRCFNDAAFWCNWGCIWLVCTD